MLSGNMVSIRYQNFIKYLAPFLMGLAIYASTMDGAFVFDDYGYIMDNPHIRHLGDIKAIWMALSAPVRFIPFVTFALNYHWHQYDLWGYHAVNLGIHLMNAVLVAWLAMLTLRVVNKKEEHNNQWVAGAAALLFVAHPIQTQAVTYLSQRFTSLATFFYLITLCLYIAARQCKIGRARGLSLYSGAAFCALCAMLSKQISLTLPVAILLYEVYFLHEGRSLKERLRAGQGKLFGAVACFLLVIPALYHLRIRSMLTMQVDSGSHFGDYLTVPVYAWTQVRVVAHYLKLFVWPLGQRVLYDFPVSNGLGDGVAWMCLGGLVGLVVIALRLRRRSVVVSFGILWFFLTLMVESSVIVIRHVIFEHRMYLPSVGLCLAVAVGLNQCCQRRKMYIMVIGCLVMALALLTWQRNRVWSTTETLWKDNVIKEPQMYRPYLNLGNAYFKRGDFVQAKTYYGQALRVQPMSSMAHNNLGNVYRKLKHYDKALWHYNRSLALNGQRAEAYTNRGDTYRILKDYPRAIADYTQSLKLNPKADDPHINRGLVYYTLGQYDEALIDTRRAIELNPHASKAFNNLGNIYRKQGHLDEALAAYRQALAINPEMARAYNNRGLVLKSLKHYDKSMRDFDQAIILDATYGAAYNNKGSLLMHLKRYESAIKAFSQAITLDETLLPAYYNRALAYETIRNFAAAEHDYLAVLALNPQYANAYLKLAHIYVQQSQYTKALRAAHQAQKLGVILNPAWMKAIEEKRGAHEPF